MGNSTVNTTITDDNDETTVSLSTSNVNEATGIVTFIATLSNPVLAGDVPVVIHTRLGDITITEGRTGTLEVTNPNTEDVYNDASTLDNAITSVDGGNFEKLTPSTDTVTANIADTINPTTVSINGIITTPSTIDVTNVEKEPNGIKVYGIDLDGNTTDLSVISGTNHDGFGVNGVTSGSGDPLELGYGSNGVSEKIVVEFDTEVKSLDVAFAWRNNREDAVVTFFDDDGNTVGSAMVSSGGNEQEALIKYYDENGFLIKTETAQGGSDRIDLEYKFEPLNGQTFSKVEFSAPGYNDDYLINKITYKEIVSSDITDVTITNGEVTLEVQTSNPPQEGTTAVAIVDVFGQEYQVQLDVNGHGTLNVAINGSEELVAVVKEIRGGNFENVDLSQANWELSLEPTASNDNIILPEDKTYYLETTDFGDSQLNVKQVEITETPNNGNLYIYSGNIVETIITNEGKTVNIYENKAEITAGTVISMTDVAAGKIIFIANENTDIDGSFKFKVGDADGNFVDTEYTTTIEVVAVADTPVSNIEISELREVVTTVVSEISTASQELGDIIKYLDSGDNVEASELAKHIEHQDQYNLELSSFGDGDVSLYDVNSNNRNIDSIDLRSSTAFDTSNAITVTNTINNTYNMTSNTVIFEGNIVQNGNVIGTSNNDTIIVKGEVQGGSNVNAGNGNDLIAIFGNIGANQPAIAGGDGTDILYLSKPASNYYFSDIHFHDNLDGHLVDKETGNTLTFNNIEGIAFGDGTGLNTIGGTTTTTTTYEYDVNISAALADTDSSETLSVVINGVPTGATLSSDTYTLNDNGNNSWTVTVPAGATSISDSIKMTLPSPTNGFTLDIIARATESHDNADGLNYAEATDSFTKSIIEDPNTENAINKGDGSTWHWDVIETSDHDDVIVAGDNWNKVELEKGNDNLTIGNGDSTNWSSIDAGKGNDNIKAGDDWAEIKLGHGDDTLQVGDAYTDTYYSTIDAGSGDDIIKAGNNWDVIDGGSGEDTLVLTNADIDLGNILSNTQIKNIENIDLTDGNAQNISINLNDILNIQDNNNELKIFGDDGDKVTLEGEAWEKGTSSEGFTEYHGTGSYSNVKVLIDDDVSIDPDL